MTDDRDPSADTGMFRAFVARGEAENAQRKTLGAPLLIAALVALVAVAVVIWLLVG